jgi:hypothetical protein
MDDTCTLVHAREAKRAFLPASLLCRSALHQITIHLQELCLPYTRHHEMRKTLRRSCDACAKSKLSCDLRTPRCSRCIKRNADTCSYANEPLSLPITPVNSGIQAFDPFDSYPKTRLPRARVQQLIQHCEFYRSH